MSETARPLLIRAGDIVRPGLRIECENGHFQAVFGEAQGEFGWPNLLDEKGVDITDQFTGRPFPIHCKECGAVAIDQAPSSPTDSENEK